MPNEKQGTGLSTFGNPEPKTFDAGGATGNTLEEKKEINRHAFEMKSAHQEHTLALTALVIFGIIVIVLVVLVFVAAWNQRWGYMGWTSNGLVALASALGAFFAGRRQGAQPDKTLAVFVDAKKVRISAD